MGLSLSGVPSGFRHHKKNRAQRDWGKGHVARLAEYSANLGWSTLGVEAAVSESRYGSSGAELQPVLWDLLRQDWRRVERQLYFAKAIRKAGQFLGKSQLTFFQISDMAGERLDLREVVRRDKIVDSSARSSRP